MGKQEYFIEAYEQDRGWYILGSDRLTHVAQRYMADYRRSFPKLPLRVVENPSRVLIVLNDPTTEA